MSQYEQFKGWRKASYSGNGSNCVEGGAAPSTIAVRDTKDREGGTLAFSVEDWSAFLADIKR